MADTSRKSLRPGPDRHVLPGYDLLGSPGVAGADQALPLLATQGLPRQGRGEEDPIRPQGLEEADSLQALEHPTLDLGQVEGDALLLYAGVILGYIIHATKQGFA